MPSLTSLLTRAVVDLCSPAQDTDAARAYLEYLYSPQAQGSSRSITIARVDEAVRKRHAKDFPEIKMVTIADFGGWRKREKHFNDGGVFDRIYTKK